jgi:hypothetical protein
MDREPFASARALQSTPPMQLVHLVARMRRPYRFFAQFDHAAWMWQRLDVGFPDAVARTLMLNHLHNLGLVDDPVQARNYLARVCGHLQRRVGIPDLFEPLPPPEIVPVERAARVARYVDLNAVRAGLVDHPLAWPWSTVRDLVGAVPKPAVDRSLHARALGHRRATRPDDWLSYLGTDNRVVDRRPLQPPVSASNRLPACSVEALREAVCSALRVRASAFRKRGPARDLLVALARDQGLHDTGLLAELCSTTRRAFQQPEPRTVPLQWLAACRVCLGDDRLIQPHAAAMRHAA